MSDNSFLELKKQFFVSPKQIIRRKQNKTYNDRVMGRSLSYTLVYVYDITILSAMVVYFKNETKN